MHSPSVVAASILMTALSACGAASDGELQQEFDANLCSGASPTVTAAMLPSRGYDGIVVVAVPDTNIAGSGVEPVAIKAGSGHSELCTRAANRSACEARVADVAVRGWASTVNSGCCSTTTNHAVIATRADEVLVANNDAELATLLGPIDQKEKAALFALARGWSIDCATPSLKRESSTWLVRATFALGCGGVTGYTLAISDSGAIVVREQVTLERGRDCV